MYAPVHVHVHVHVRVRVHVHVHVHVCAFMFMFMLLASVMFMYGLMICVCCWLHVSCVMLQALVLVMRLIPSLSPVQHAVLHSPMITCSHLHLHPHPAHRISNRCTSIVPPRNQV